MIIVEMMRLLILSTVIVVALYCIYQMCNNDARWIRLLCSMVAYFMFILLLYRDNWIG